MGKSFILKGRRGEAAGFLQQGGGRIRCKARSEDGAQGRLVLRDGEGRGREIELALDGCEREWPDDGRTAYVCAYVAADGKLLLATDEQGRRAFERDSVRVQREARREETRARESDAPAQKRAELESDAPAREEVAEEGEAERPMPDRRWPPPPCQPGARYRDGRWLDEAEAEQLRPSDP